MSPQRRSLGDRIVEVAYRFVAVAIGAAVFADTWPQSSAWGRPVDFVLGCAAIAALWWRRQRPTEVGLATALAATVSAFAAGAALVGAFTAAVHSPRRGLLAVVAVSAGSVAVFPAIYSPDDGYLLNLVIGGLLTALVFAWGLVMRSRREHAEALHERAVEDARDAERRRIAREMHDVLAHRLSLLALHAGALEYRGDEAAGVIRETARAALEDLRDVIGVLRDGDGVLASEPPQPTLADLDGLVEECRAAGMRVDVAITATDLPDGLGRTIYRIVQEGLTNARKHAPGAAVEVRVDGGDDLRVTVHSRRPVGVGAATLPGAGSGLIGLEERVALTGGALRAGWVGADSGDFVLEAVIPWSAS